MVGEQCAQQAGCLAVKPACMRGGCIKKQKLTNNSGEDPAATENACSADEWRAPAPNSADLCTFSLDPQVILRKNYPVASRLGDIVSFGTRRDWSATRSKCQHLFPPFRRGSHAWLMTSNAMAEGHQRIAAQPHQCREQGAGNFLQEEEKKIGRKKYKDGKSVATLGNFGHVFIDGLTTRLDFNVAGQFNLLCWARARLTLFGDAGKAGYFDLQMYVPANTTPR
jgi:hypothetical protein